jgi:HEPN domain-containing protein
LKTQETNPGDWFLLATERLESADALFAVRGACYSTVELLQEAVERYLKGYLISKGWRLERIHDLNRLLDLAGSFEDQFLVFAPLAQSLTEQFWAQHYPGDELTDVGADYEDLRQQAGELVALILALPAPETPKQP